MNAPQHDNFVDQLARPARGGQDRIAKSYALASRILGDLSLLVHQEPQNVVQVNLRWIHEPAPAKKWHWLTIVLI